MTITPPTLLSLSLDFANDDHHITLLIPTITLQQASQSDWPSAFVPQLAASKLFLALRFGKLAWQIKSIANASEGTTVRAS